MKIEFEHMQAGILGWFCGQCNRGFAFLSGAVLHELAIDENGGVCPDAPRHEEEEEE